MLSFDQLPCPVLVTDRKGLVSVVNQSLLSLVGGESHAWLSKPMDEMFPRASCIFLQTHIWPMLLRDGQVREVRLEVLDRDRKSTPVYVNSNRVLVDGVEQFTWVFFVTIERSRYENELLLARQRAEDLATSLAQSERFIRTVADAIPSMIGYWDADLKCRFANKPYLEWFGRSPSALIGMSMADVLGPALFQQNTHFIQGALAGQLQEFERAIQKADGSVGYALANYIPDIGSDGGTQGFFAVVTDVTRFREANDAIRLSASVFGATSDAIVVTDTSANIVSVNPAFTALTGYTSEELVGQHSRVLKSGRHEASFFEAMFQELHAHKLWRGQVWNRRKDGEVYLARLSISAISDEAGVVNRYVGVSADITQEWHKEQSVQHMALHDDLTALPNRALAMERLTHLIAMSAREHRNIALLFLDLDGFKEVNDTWGHSVGDQVLKTVAARMLGLLRPADTVARLGGDEFIVLLDNADNSDAVGMIAARAIEQINLPMELDAGLVQVGTSIGIAMFPGIPTTPEQLLKCADEAMYTAKNAGKNTYRFAQPLT